MRRLRRLSPAVLLAAAGCATAPVAEQISCDGFVPAQPAVLRAPEYPPTALKARMRGESTHEVVVDRSGKVRDARIVGTTFMLFALAADGALRKSLYAPATLEGRPVGTRFWVRFPFGIPANIEMSPARNRVTAFVPGKESPAARWQLARRVARVTIVADVASAPPAEVSVVAVAPDGAERVLLPARSDRPRRILETVKTGDFFSRAGEYRVSLRHGERPIAEGGFTVAEEERSAVVNACGAPG